MSPKPPWRERKKPYLAHLDDANEPVLRVSLADKLHYARAILFDLRSVGLSVWQRFGAPAEEQVWYYDALAGKFQERLPGPIAAELARTMDEIRAHTGISAPDSVRST